MLLECRSEDLNCASCGAQYRELQQTLAELNEDKEQLRCNLEQVAQANAQQGHLIAGLRAQLKSAQRRQVVMGLTCLS